MKPQTAKRIESAQKRIAEYQSKIQKFADRRDKALAAAGLTESDFTASMRANWGEVNLVNRDLYQTIGYEKIYRIIDNWKSVLNNEYKLKQDLTLVETLRKEAEIEEEKELSYRQTIEASKPLENLLREITKDFREEWFNKMHIWFDKHFDNIEIYHAKYEKKLQRLNAIWNKIYFVRAHHRLRKAIEEETQEVRDSYNRTSWIKAWSGKKDLWLDRQMKDLAVQWEADLQSLAIKCRKFALDESSIQISGVRVTDKGFETYITDNKNRRIYARMIWAAEYSEFVQPHVRYIVTEKKI